MSASEILIDTSLLWGLVFKNSKYRPLVLKLAQNTTLLIPKITVLELVFAAYRSASRSGQNPQLGLQVIIEIRDFLIQFETNLTNLGVKAKWINIELEDICKSLDYITTFGELLKQGSKKTKWIRLFDALLLAIAHRLHVKLATSDKVIYKLAQRLNIECILVKP